MNNYLCHIEDKDLSMQNILLNKQWDCVQIIKNLVMDIQFHTNTLVQIYQRSLFHVVYLHRLQKLQNALLILSALHYQNLCFTYSNRCFCCFGAFLILTNIYDFVSKRPLPAWYVQKVVFDDGLYVIINSEKLRLYFWDYHANIIDKTSS